MKPLLFLTPLLLASCAPRAVLLLDAGSQPSPAEKPAESVATAPTTTAPSPQLPERRDDDLGLLEPRSIAEIPDEREMRPTVDPDEKPAVIATPPSSE